MTLPKLKSRTPATKSSTRQKVATYLHRHRTSRFFVLLNRVWSNLHAAIKKFLHIDGVQWAAAFAFNMFFSLFSLSILFVIISSTFTDRIRASKAIITYIENYVPITGEMHTYVFDTITGVINAREKAGALAFLALIWVSLQSFMTLIVATNRAWETIIHANWWRLSVKGLLLLGTTAGMVVFGMAVPVLLQIAKAWYSQSHGLNSWMFDVGGYFIPLIVTFISLTLFYKFAPLRHTRYADIWIAALSTSIFLLASEKLFAVYLKEFSSMNAVYGTFGGIMALLLWIYLVGCILIFGACLCAVQTEVTPAGNESARETG